MERYEKIFRDNAGYIAIILLLALYILTKLSLFALLCAISIVAIFAYETYEGAKRRGWKNELGEIVIAVVAGIVIWYGAGFLLGTAAPLDAVVSCSMLPNLDRGDMVLLKGGEISVPTVEVTALEWEQIEGRMRTNYTCGPCEEAAGYKPYNFSICSISCEDSCLLAIDGKPVFSGSAETLFSYNYGICKLRSADGEIINSVCVKSVTIKGKTFEESAGNDIVVYEPRRGSIFVGSTIHRVLARVSVEGEVYYLIKGDNNEILDVQAPAYRSIAGNTCIFYTNSTRENKPVPQENIKGKVIARIPYMGYLKLFLWGYIENPAGCDTVIEHNT